MPVRAYPLVKRWNPSGEYSERIATLWRDLETLYGTEDTAGLGGSRTYYDANRLAQGEKSGKFRGFRRDLLCATVIGAHNCRRSNSELDLPPLLLIRAGLIW